MVDILHRVGATVSPAEVYAALTTTDGLAGWWTEDTKGEGDAGRSAGSSASASRAEPAASTCRSSTCGPTSACSGRSSRDPRSGSGPRSSSSCTQEDDFTIVMFAPHGLARAGAVHEPLQHQVGDVPDEPQGSSSRRARASRLRTTSRSATGTERPRPPIRLRFAATSYAQHRRRIALPVSPITDIMSSCGHERTTLRRCPPPRPYGPGRSGTSSRGWCGRSPGRAAGRRTRSGPRWCARRRPASRRSPG